MSSNQTTAIKLTPRELAVLKDIGEGKTNKEIAFDHKLSYSTIVHQRAALYRKMKVKCTADLIRMAVKQKLITIGEGE
jgi:DNA-binding NarL/FixJ family response regulator